MEDRRAIDDRLAAERYLLDHWSRVSARVSYVLDAYEDLPSRPRSLAASRGNSGTSANDYWAARCSGDASQFHGGNSRSATHPTGPLLRVIPGYLRTQPRTVPRHARTDRHHLQVRANGNLERHRS